MADIQEVDPATIRFTQDCIGLHFQEPYGNLSVRDAVQLISEGEMSASTFERIQVCLHDGVMFSIDNRRLWVFRMSKCEKIEVHVLKKHHWRFKCVLASENWYQTLKSESFFPKVRGDPDISFDSRFPQPSPQPEPFAKFRSKSGKRPTAKSVFSKILKLKPVEKATQGSTKKLKGRKKPRIPLATIQEEAGATKGEQGGKGSVGVHDNTHRGATSVNSWKKKKTVTGRGRHEEEILGMCNPEGKEDGTGSTDVMGINSETAKTMVFHADAQIRNVNEEVEAVPGGVSPLVTLWRIVTGALEMMSRMFIAFDTFSHCN